MAVSLWNDCEVEVHRGDIFALGSHRLICGDSTNPDDVARLMQGEIAALCHADPPYGMGKEKDGVANDNLYREKLDAFQMRWWRACRSHLTDNASAYIWGNAEDLWRLWYVGGLKDSERLTFRNELVWDKQDGENMTLRVNGKTFKGMRSYYNSERCLFFMLGEQGFNNNSDNYWEQWEPIREYLADECKKMGWKGTAISHICKVDGRMCRHWVTRSQWMLPTEEHYKRLQEASQGQAFKRDYDTLKRDFLSLRAYFDNTHENMTDVWQFPRVKGAERWGHPTPKPVPMIERIIKSSSPIDSLIYDPFLGSGTTLISAERAGRRCYGCEINHQWCELAIQRWQQATGQTARLLEGVST